jgi:hypothetical protein
MWFRPCPFFVDYTYGPIERPAETGVKPKTFTFTAVAAVNIHELAYNQ